MISSQSAVISMRSNMAASLCRCIRRSSQILRHSNLHKVNNAKRYEGSLSEKLSSLQDQYPEVELSTEDFKHVERLLPPATVPPPPEHTQYPTPSGWVPPAEKGAALNYSVSRSKNHQFPVYMQVKNGGTRRLTQIKHINGDIWALEADLRQYLEKETGKQVLTQVHEVAQFIRIKGLYLEQVSKFLLDKGF